MNWLAALVAVVPAMVVTETFAGPGPAAAGAIAVIWPTEPTVALARVEPKETGFTLAKSVPE